MHGLISNGLAAIQPIWQPRGPAPDYDGKQGLLARSDSDSIVCAGAARATTGPATCTSALLASVTSRPELARTKRTRIKLLARAGNAASEGPAGQELHDWRALARGARRRHLDRREAEGPRGCHVGSRRT